MRRLILFAFLVISTSVFSQSLEKQVDQFYPHLDSLYKHLHANPELSFEEKNTSKKIASELRSAGFEVTENIGGFGVVGLLKNGKGPVVLVRTDMDALPVVEETEFNFASKVMTELNGNQVGVMHACGHDIHMSVFIGTAKMLSQNKNKWKGTLVFISQPAEERASGARAMLKDGLFEKFPVPDYCLALHVSGNMPAGKVALTSGYAYANVDMMDITVYGEGGHGAYPHTTIDPIVLSARIILDLQTIVSRELSPLDPAVVTVGSIHGGNKGNVIPDAIKLELTLRSYTSAVRNATIEKIKRICNGLAAAAGLPEEKYPKVYLRDESTLSLYNDPALTARMKKVFISTIGEENVLDGQPVMGGEDFSAYGRTDEKIPILQYNLGTIEPELVNKAMNKEIKLPSLHSAFYTPTPEPSIKTGVITMTSGVLDLLKQ